MLSASMFVYGHYMVIVWSSNIVVEFALKFAPLRILADPCGSWRILADLEEQTQVISCLLIHLAGATELVVPSPWLEIGLRFHCAFSIAIHCNSCASVELLAKSAQQASKSCLWKVAAMQRDLRGRDMKQDSLILLVYFLQETSKHLNFPDPETTNPNHDIRKHDLNDWRLSMEKCDVICFDHF